MYPAFIWIRSSESFNGKSGVGFFQDEIFGQIVLIAKLGINQKFFIAQFLNQND